MNKNLSIKDLGINKLDSGLTEYVFDGLKESNNSISLVIDNLENINLVFINLDDGFSCDLLLEKNTNVNLSIFLKNPKNTVNFSAKLKQNAYLNAYCADFSKDKNDSNFLVDLDEENSSCDWHLASLSSNYDNKNISVSINHNAPNTNARFSFFSLYLSFELLFISVIFKFFFEFSFSLILLVIILYYRFNDVLILNGWSIINEVLYYHGK